MKYAAKEVGLLLDDSGKLLKSLANGEENSLAFILNKLINAFNICSKCWRGKDAGVNIAKIVTVYNKLVNYRIKMADLAIHTNNIGRNIRDIQSIGNSNFTVPDELTDDLEYALKDEYNDERDTIWIDPSILNAQKELKFANNAIDDVALSFEKLNISIFNNWVEGERRDEFITDFSTFEADLKSYKLELVSVLDSISNAISNYGGH